MDGRIDGWMGGWMDGWMEMMLKISIQINAYIIFACALERLTTQPHLKDNEALTHLKLIHRPMCISTSIHKCMQTYINTYIHKYIHASIHT